MRIPRYRVALVREENTPISSRVINGPRDAFDLLRDAMGDADHENLLTLLLDTRNRVIGTHSVSIASLQAGSVPPRDTFTAAILGNAASIILAHGHPSGDPEPSHEDIAVTDHLKRAGEILGVPVLDHLVLCDESFRSLKECHLI